MLAKMAMLQDGHWTIQDAPPALFHPAGPNSLLGKDSNWPNTPAWQGKLAKAFNGYLTTLSSDRRILLRQYELQDIAFKVVGVGSVGTFCLVMLFIDGQGKPLFLQVKEARAAQNETDCKTFMQACRSGKLEARSDEDMAADLAAHGHSYFSGAEVTVVLIQRLVALGVLALLLAIPGVDAAAEAAQASKERR